MGTLQQVTLARGYTLGRLKKAAPEQWDAQPEGFNNTIRWNAGHIFVSAESFVSQAIEDYEAVHPEWAEFFSTGTSPAAWDLEQVPSVEELMTALKEQGKRIPQVLEGELGNILAEPISLGDVLRMDTVEDVAQFNAWHEGIHAGLIDGLVRASK